MIFPILTNIQSGSLQEFISFWSKLYVYDNAVLYERIHNTTLSENDLKDLYKWKNGMKLSQAKEKSLNTKIISKIEIVNNLRAASNLDLEYFLKEFKQVSVVWKVFLLHILKPNRFPIYDQHVHRAYRFINNQSSNGIKASMNESVKLKFYFEEYYPFVRESKITNLKKMDEAFFAFGQFINIGNQKMLAS
ncbi:MAG: hypothetical protein L7S72_05595 [Flavobacteriales bacterium]|nr:hypothetical protein [Flavobacteriales bacterium]